jgi:hypothetical protein
MCIGSALPCVAPPARLGHPSGGATNDDPDQQRTEQVGVERQHERDDGIGRPEGVEHQADAVTVGDGQRDQQDRDRERDEEPDDAAQHLPDPSRLKRRVAPCYFLFASMFRVV